MNKKGNTMETNTGQDRFRSVWHLLMFAFLLAASLTAMLNRVSAAPVDDDFKIVGVVSSRPAAANGIGLWGIVDDTGHPYTAQVDANTDFDDQIPQIGDRIEAEVETGGLQLLALKIKITESGGDDEIGNSEVEGTVINRPAASDGIGTWLIQTQLFLTETVVVDANTRFDEGAPGQGVWVEVKGTRQLDGSILATRIRPDDYEDGELVVWLKPGVVPSTIEARYGVEAKSSLLASANIYLFSTEDEDEPGLVELVNSDDDVIRAELNYVQGVPEQEGYSTWGWGGINPDGYINQQAFAQVNLPEILDKFDGSGTVVAVLDTGVALTHTALITRLLPGLDVISDDTVAQDEPAGLAWGHGTHVAGIVARVAPGARILPIRVLDSNGRGNTFLLAYAIDWAIKQNVDIINLSLGAEVDSTLLRDKIDEAVSQGIVVVAAAGNANQETISYPAGYDDVIAVTAVDSSSRKAGFASYGAWVDIAAPGVGITSTVIGPLGQGYASWTGTSMATPFVSGAAALVRHGNPASSSATVSNSLTSTTTGLNQSNPDYTGKLGGLLNISAAIPDTTFEPTEFLYLPSLQN